MKDLYEDTELQPQSKKRELENDETCSKCNNPARKPKGLRLCAEHMKAKLKQDPYFRFKVISFYCLFLITCRCSQDVQHF